MESLQSIALPKMKEYYDGGLFTDLTITCVEQKFKCHKLVVCSQSKFFEAACTNGFQETSTSEIDLSADDPNHIELMLEFFYTQTYKTEQAPAMVCIFNGPKSAPGVHISLYALGDKYGISALCRYSADCFRESIGQSISTAGVMSCITLVYHSTPDSNRTLRDLVISEIIRRSADITADMETSKFVMQLIHINKQFREDLVLGLLQSQVLAGDERVRNASLLDSAKKYNNHLRALRESFNTSR